LCIAFLPVACSKQQATQSSADAATSQGLASATSSPSAHSLSLPVNFQRHTGDLDEMVKARNIRALVVLNPIGFFYDKGMPKGAIYEALEEFQKFANKKLNTGKFTVNITYLPVAPGQVEAALTEGIGDLVANTVVITPAREQRSAFSTPIQTDVTQIVVSGSSFGSVSSLEDLGGKDIYVTPLMASYENLQKANASLQKAGKPLIQIKAADKNLNEDDLIQMVNAGLIPATVTTKQRAELWSKVFDNLKPHP
jgi:membrane-bound lytic murein transglycosylase MltF